MTDEAKRNQNPTPQATFAMLWWSERYSKQRGGSMDFWDALTNSEKAFCHDRVKEIFEAGRPQNDEASFEQVNAGEWVTPKRRGYRISCCDCGLVHKMDFRVVLDQRQRVRIQLRAFREDK